MELRTKIVVIGNALVIFALGLLYVEGLKFALSIAIYFIPEPSTNVQKMLFTGGSASVVCLTIFLVNRYMTRQKMLPLGLAAGTLSFLWFYVLRAEQAVLSHIVGVLMTSYSAFAMVVFVGLPPLIGWAFRKTAGMDGVAWIASSTLREGLKR